MKWEAVEGSDFPVLYVDGGELDREMEIWCQGKKFTLRLYRNSSLLSDEDPKSYKTLAAAKNAGAKWLKKEIDKVVDAIAEVLEKK